MADGKYALFGIFMGFIGACAGAMIEHGSSAICSLGLRNCPPTHEEKTVENLIDLSQSCQASLSATVDSLRVVQRTLEQSNTAVALIEREFPINLPSNNLIEDFQNNLTVEDLSVDQLLSIIKDGNNRANAVFQFTNLDYSDLSGAIEQTVQELELRESR